MMNLSLAGHDKNLYFKNVTEAKKVLYNTLYNNQNILNILLSEFNNELSIFNIEYNEQSKGVTLKIKKTLMKKIDVNEIYNKYYGLIDEILYTFIVNNMTYLEQNLTTEAKTFILDRRFTYLLYTVTLISDNIILLYL